MIAGRLWPPVFRVALAIGAILLASSVPAVQALPTRHMDAAGGEPEVLRKQVVGLFDELDRLSRAIEGVRADIASARDRITELFRQIDAHQRILDRRAAEAYISQPVGIDALLGASSFTDLQDTLEFLDAVSEKDQDVLLSLLHRKAEVELERARLEGLEANLSEERERLDATAADLVEKLQQRRALLRQRAGERAALDDGSVGDSPPSPPPPTPPLPNLVPGREAVTELIRDHFAPLGARTTDVAICVAEEESSLDPLAVNPVTDASGLFQFIPSTWASLSEPAGWSGASVFDARANAAVAAWTVAQYGWHPWRSVAADCGS